MTKEDFFKSVEKVLGDKIISLNVDDCVSCDFISNESPTIIDYNSVIQVSEKTLKLNLWYDNEWSYASQMIKMCNFIFLRNKGEALH